MQVKNLRTRVGGPKYIIKNINIWHNTKKLENIQKLWESVLTKFILCKNGVSGRD